MSTYELTDYQAAVIREALKTELEANEGNIRDGLDTDGGMEEYSQELQDAIDAME